MALENLEGSTKYLDALNKLWPLGTDGLSDADAHIRGLKNVLDNTFPNVAGVVSSTHTELNSLSGITAFAISLFDDADASTARSTLGLGTAAVANTGTADANVPTGTDLKGTVRSFTKQQRPAYAALSIASGAVTWNLDDAQVGLLALTENVTSLSISNQIAGASYQLLITGGASWTITWPGTVLWAYGGTEPTLQGTDLVTLVSNGSNLLATHVPNFS